MELTTFLSQVKKQYSIRKSKSIFRSFLKAYRKRKRHFSSDHQLQVKSTLEALQDAIIHKDPIEATRLCKTLEGFSKTIFKKSPFQKLKDFLLNVSFALIIALFVRQMWFELYEIPTGSMRPTLQEKDRLVVSKTTFGINAPLSTSHFLFEPDLVQRSNIFIFSGKGMDIPDVNTLYFYIFPGKKQYIKRLMGKPGDQLYFYGGKIYGIDRKGNDITPTLQPPDLAKIDHVPFINLDGKVVVPSSSRNGIYSPITLYQMNEPVAKMSVGSLGRVKGEILYGNDPEAKYYDLWGFKNYATARLLTEDEVKKDPNYSREELASAPLYLQLCHHPDISKARVGRDIYGRTRPILSFTKSLIPIDESHAKKLFANLYTARFLVKNGLAYRYGMSRPTKTQLSYAVPLDNVPDGTYEFYYGVAYQIGWQGISKQLPPSHPIYQFSIERIATLFNAGMEFDRRWLEDLTYMGIHPARYAYYRNGGLYLLGAEIYGKNDPLLQKFISEEMQRNGPLAFIDSGPPLSEDGKLNRSIIEKFGVKIPDGHYLALGDNYAMSSDSRDFGFVPQRNMRGAPTFIFWPTGPRFGSPNQPGYPLVNLPRTVIWLLAALCFLFWKLHYNRRYRIPTVIG